MRHNRRSGGQTRQEYPGLVLRVTCCVVTLFYITQIAAPEDLFLSACCGCFDVFGGYCCDRVKIFNTKKDFVNTSENVSENQ